MNGLCALSLIYCFNNVCRRFSWPFVAHFPMIAHSIGIHYNKCVICFACEYYFSLPSVLKMSIALFLFLFLLIDKRFLLLINSFVLFEFTKYSWKYVGLLTNSFLFDYIDTTTKKRLWNCDSIFIPFSISPPETVSVISTSWFKMRALNFQASLVWWAKRKWLSF